MEWELVHVSYCIPPPLYTPLHVQSGKGAFTQIVWTTRLHNVRTQHDRETHFAVAIKNSSNIGQVHIALINGLQLEL